MNSPQHEAFIEQALSSFRSDESPDESLVLADYFMEQGDLRHAASALDRAYGLNPDDKSVADRRNELLDQFEVIEHGLRFRYVPAGTFLMGSEAGDHDEKPVHPVRLGEFWVSETTVTSAAFSDICRTKGPVGVAHSTMWGWQEERLREEDKKAFLSQVFEPNVKFRCTADPSLTARRPLIYDGKPMVVTSEAQLKKFFKHIQTSDVRYSLPTEEQWEKAARGGRIAQPYPWGIEMPELHHCNFSAYGDSARIKPSKSFASNGYGLYAMSGGVWEWTSSMYDSLSYESSDTKKNRKQKNTVFRGGSWADCAEAVTVSFRMSARTSGRDVQTRSPTFGFRVFRFA